MNRVLTKIAKAILPRSVVTKVRLMRERRRITTFSPRTVEHTYGECRLRVYLSDQVAEEWYDHDWTEPLEISVLRSERLRPGALVFDLGMHQAVVAMMLAEAVRPGGRVVGVEALPHNVAAARRNTELNSLTDVEVLHSAVAAKPGRVTIAEKLNSHVNTGAADHGEIAVEAVTIDQLAERFGKPDVLFIDIEGFEIQALEGGRATMANRPDVFIECHTGCGLEAAGGTVEQLLAYFPPDRYRVRVFAPESTQVLELRDAPGSLTASRFFIVATALR